MKKSILIFFALFLLSSIVLAVDVSKVTNNPQANQSKPAEQEGLFKKLDQQTEDVLQQQVAIPEPFFSISKLVFGIKNETTYQELIVIIGIWIGFLILMLSVLQLMPFMNKGPTKVLGAIAITSLVSLTGSLRIMVDFLFNLVGFFKWIESWTILTTALVILLAFAIVFAFNWFARYFMKEKKLTEAEETGRKIWFFSKLGEETEKSMKEK